MKREAGAALSEKLFGACGQRSSKGKSKMWRNHKIAVWEETGVRRVASPEQFLDLQEDLRCSDGKVCQGHAETGNLPPSCVEFDPPLPRYQLGLRWMKTTLMRKAILVKMSYLVNY